MNTVSVNNEVKQKEKSDDNLNLESILQKFSSLIITALGVCTALAWNDAFQNFFKNNHHITKYGPWVYATIITMIALISIIYLQKLTKYVEDMIITKLEHKFNSKMECSNTNCTPRCPFACP